MNILPENNPPERQENRKPRKTRQRQQDRALDNGWHSDDFDATGQRAIMAEQEKAQFARLLKASERRNATLTNRIAELEAVIERLAQPQREGGAE